MRTDRIDGDGERLAKRVAQMAACSRREAELLIENGAVRVDGRVVEVAGARVLPAQQVTIAVGARAEPVAPVTLLLHKPAGTPWDAAPERLLLPARRSNLVDSRQPVLQRHLAGQRCFTALEQAASGLVVFSQDQRIERKLTEDAAVIENELVVDVQGEVSTQQLQRLNQSPVVDGRAMFAAKVSIGRQVDRVTGLRFAIKGHWAGQVAQMCDAVQLRILAMKRIRVGRVPLAALAPGEWRLLLPHERF